MENSINSTTFKEISYLINTRSFSHAENLLNSINNKNADYHYLYSLLLQKKAWFEGSLTHLKKAISLDPNNSLYKDSLISLMSRHRRYSDDYYGSGYRRNRGCSCCCCDDCCCDCGNFSCCDLICLDQCCECMGGDLIDCI